MSERNREPIQFTLTFTDKEVNFMADMSAERGVTMAKVVHDALAVYHLVELKAKEDPGIWRIVLPDSPGCGLVA